MIDITAGAYLIRTASVFDFNGDFTLSFAFAFLTGGSFGRGLVTIGHDDLSDYDIYETQPANNKVFGHTRAAGGADVVTSDTTDAIAVDDTIYYTALRRTGTTLDVFLGLTPETVTLQATGTNSDAGRAAVQQILFNGYNVAGTHSGFGFLGRARAYELSNSLAEIKTELAYNAAQKAGVWADWQMLDAAHAGDDSSGNSRPLSTVNVINDGPVLTDPVLRSAAVGGTGGDGMSETEVVAGGQVITLTLTGDLYIP